MVASPPSFCPDCGAALETRRVEGRERAYCAGCETVVWQNPVPTAGVAVVDGERVLLVKRRYDPDAGCWAVPAGFVEREETAHEAAARELHEETGVDVAPSALSLLSVGQLEHPSGRMLVTIGFAVSRGRTSGDLSPGSDALDARYLSPESFETSDESFRRVDSERVRAAVERFGSG